MLDSKLAALILMALLAGSGPASGAGAADLLAPELNLTPSALQERLDQAEKNFRDGKLSVAVDEANSLVKLTDSSFLQSDRVAREAKADLSVFQLKGGHPEETARLMRELLLSLQLEMPISPDFDTKVIENWVSAPAMLKQYFSKVIERLGEKEDTKQIIYSIIENTYPRDYGARLKSYSKRLEASLVQVGPLRSEADTEELKYSDALRALDDQSGEPNTNDIAGLKKLGASLDELATQAQQMPVGDLRPALGLYTLALVANGQRNYPLAEEFGKQSLDHVNALAENFPIVSRIQLALAYSLLQQGKTEEFKSVMGSLLKRIGDQERLLVGAACLTERSGDASGALSIYKRALELRTKGGAKSPPDWNEAYNLLLKKVGTSN